MRVTLFSLAAVLMHQAAATLHSRGLDATDYNGAEAHWVQLRSRYGEDCHKYHTVRSGETCAVIVDKYGIHLSEFYDWNGQVNSQCTNLKPNKKYCVSKSGSGDSNTGGCALYHKVSKGDTCSKVAKQYDLSVGQFYDLNSQVNRGSCDNLFIGHSYCVKYGGNPAKDDDDDKKPVKKASKKATPTDKKKHHDDDDDNDDEKDEKKQPSKTKATTAPTTTTTTTKEAERTTTTTATTTTTTTTTEKAAAATTKVTNLRQRQVLKRNVKLTYYWTAHPEDYSSGKKVAIKTCGGKTIARVAESFADALVMEGSGVVSKSSVVNLGSCACKNYACFMELDPKSEPYGLTAHGTSLDPFITIAANDIKRNTKIYVPEMDGWSIPGSSKKHNGCLLVDDKSWSFGGNHIDWFVNFKKHYSTLNSKHKLSKVDIYEGGNCKLQKY